MYYKATYFKVFMTEQLKHARNKYNFNLQYTQTTLDDYSSISMFSVISTTKMNESYSFQKSIRFSKI